MAMVEPIGERTRWLRPEWVVAAMLVVVPLATGNLTGLGIGTYPQTYDTVALPRFAAMLALVSIAWTLWWWKSALEGEPLRVTAAWAVLVALGAWAVLSAIASPDRWFTILGQSERLEGLVTIVFYAALYGLALQTLRSRRAVQLAAGSFAGASTLLALFGLIQFAGLDQTNYRLEDYGFTLRVAFATLGNPNFLGALLVLALPCAAALSLRARGASRWAWGACAGIILLGLVATLTRGAWLAAGVEGVVALAILLRQRHRRASASVSKRNLWIAVAVGLVLIAASTALLLRPDLRTGKLSSSSGAESRFALQRVAIAAAVSRPIVGYGPDAFIAAFRAHSDVAGTLDTRLGVNNAHSWPLQFAATLGFPGAALLVLALVVALWGGAWCLSRSEIRSDPLLAGVWVACLGYSLTMLFNVAMLASTVPFWILLGALGSRRARDVAVPRILAIVAGSIGTVVALAAVAASISIVVADARFLTSRLVFNEFQTGDAVAESSAATRLNPLSIKYARGAAQVRAARVMAAIASGASADNVYLEFASARSAFDRALAIDPNDYAALAWLAALEAGTGSYTHDASLLSSAREHALAAARLDPTRTEVRALAAGDFSAAAQRAALAVPSLP